MYFIENICNDDVRGAGDFWHYSDGEASLAL